MSIKELAGEILNLSTKKIQNQKGLDFFEFSDSLKSLFFDEVLTRFNNKLITNDQAIALEEYWDNNETWDLQEMYCNYL